MPRKSRSQTKATTGAPGGAPKGNGKKRSSSKKAAKRRGSKSRSPPPPTDRVAKTVVDKENEAMTHEQKVAKALGQPVANTTNTALKAVDLAKPTAMEPVAAAEPASPPAAPLAEQVVVSATPEPVEVDAAVEETTVTTNNVEVVKEVKDEAKAVSEAVVNRALEEVLDKFSASLEQGLVRHEEQVAAEAQAQAHAEAEKVEVLTQEAVEEAPVAVEEVQAPLAVEAPEEEEEVQEAPEEEEEEVKPSKAEPDCAEVALNAMMPPPLDSRPSRTRSRSGGFACIGNACSIM